MTLFKRSKVSLSLLLFCILLLSALLGGCTSIFPAKDEQSEKAIKILIVEFGSGTPIPNMKVNIRDANTNELVMEKTADANGEVDIYGLKDGKKYLFTPSSIYESESEGIAQLVKVEESTSYIRLETYYVRNHKGANVPVVLQKPVFPHGCEITALTAVLQFYGANVTKEAMEKKYLPKGPLVRANGVWIGPDPAKKYAGNPASETDGMYAFAPVIEKAAQNYIKQTKTALKVRNMTGASKEQILDKVNKGIPVITWVTLDLTPPQMKQGWTIKGTDHRIEMYRNLHVVVVTGYQDGKVIVMDPLKGYVVHNEEDFFKSFKEMKSQAIVLEK